MITSVHSEKTCLKKLIIIMTKSQEVMVFSGRQKLTSAMKTEARKVMVDFKFDGKSPSTASRSQVSKRGIWKFVLVGGAVCAIPTSL